jgi:Myb-like DNA-binding domain
VEQLRDRSNDHVRDRFMSNLDKSVRKGPWTEAEMQTLISAQKKFGNKWTLISQVLPGRSVSDIKNRWYNNYYKGSGGDHSESDNSSGGSSPISSGGSKGGPSKTE